MSLYYDFHIHSALSPCGDNDMTPNNIINMYPVKKIKTKELLYLEENSYVKKKIRIKTGLERFNERYNQ